MDLGLRHKVVFITGGSKGIGRACALEFAREGARVAICARREDELRRAAEAIRQATGADVFPVAGDMTRWEDVQRCVDAAAAHFGGLDILVNCAGASPGGLILNLAEEDWTLSLQLGRICTPEEVASVVVFIASERASYMNGAWVTLDGGQRKAIMDI